MITVGSHYAYFVRTRIMIYGHLHYNSSHNIPELLNVCRTIDTSVAF